MVLIGTSRCNLTPTIWLDVATKSHQMPKCESRHRLLARFSFSCPCTAFARLWLPESQSWWADTEPRAILWYWMARRRINRYTVKTLSRVFPIVAPFFISHYLHQTQHFTDGRVSFSRRCHLSIPTKSYDFCNDYHQTRCCIDDQRPGVGKLSH